jgi:hypothetical protein
MSEPETITQCKIFTEVFGIAVAISFICYYIFSYVEMLDVERSSTLGKVFLAAIVGDLVILVKSILDTAQKSMYIGEVFNRNTWAQIKWTDNKEPFTLLKIGHLMNAITNIWICTQVIPFSSDNCVVSDHACYSMRIIATLFLIYTGLVVVWVLGMCCTFIVDREQPPRARMSVRMGDYAREKVMDMNPLSNWVSTENKCVICLDDEAEGLVILTCGHKFHNECIRGWMLRSPTCPTCRHPIPSNYIPVPDTTAAHVPSSSIV